MKYYKKGRVIRGVISPILRASLQQQQLPRPQRVPKAVLGPGPTSLIPISVHQLGDTGTNP